MSPASLVCDGAQYYDKSWTTAASIMTSPPIREGEADNLVSGLGDGTLDIISRYEPIRTHVRVTDSLDNISVTTLLTTVNRELWAKTTSKTFPKV